MDDQTRQALSLPELIQGRRSVRRFVERPVPRDALLAILEAARWAPSPHGRQPWRFVVLTDPAPKARLSDAMGETWVRQLALDGQDVERVAERLRISKLRIRTGPAIVIPGLYMAEMDHYPDEERTAAEQIMAIQSLGCAIQNMLLTAYSLGLDAGWMCAPLFCPDVVREALDLDESLVPHALIPIGYAAADPNRRPRKPLEELVLWR
jgi:coenzyme F420-0:L-glutamate ligase / coenzyme F420-1:gamma-L-glutamate ligase